MRVVRTPVRAPRADAVYERFLGSVRRECVDHVLVLGERQLRRALAEYVGHFNHARPHQALDKRTPTALGSATRHPPTDAGRRIVALPVLGGLHHEYRHAA